jgi:riboflavin kinase/FMN adenylyltransferase
MIVMAILMGILFAGSIGLTQYLGVVSSHDETILSALARRLLGRPFSLEGEVVRGTATGAHIRVPTANLSVRNEIVPRTGVYVTRAVVDGKPWKGVTNIGTRPTVAGETSGAVTIETHILDFERELYGTGIELEFLLRLREERRFPSTAELVAQIRRDVALARRYFLWLERAAPAWLREREPA